MIEIMKKEDMERMNLMDIHETWLEDGRDDAIESLEYRNFEFLAAGSVAAVFNIPDEEDRVLRVSDENDGWPLYANACQGDPMAPKVYSMCYHEGLWFAIVEKLAPMSSVEDMFEAFGILEGDERKQLVRDVNREHPGFEDFYEMHLTDADDISTRNMMWRYQEDGSRQMVVNDPLSMMELPVFRQLCEHYRLQTNDPSMEPS